MRYKNATQHLPKELLEQVQQYADGEFLYIPRIKGAKREWGAKTATRRELRARNERIYKEYLAGERADALSRRYFLSVKSIQRIIAGKRRESAQHSAEKL